ncbi:MAG TPA: hypothetical protein VHD84_03500 [Candidatus Saccharimonadales bacterium]|nr:hypothetical protein [Candidatus Saccharimonadales bacterium]
MKYKYSKYDIHRGAIKIKTKTAVTVSALSVLAAGAVGSALLLINPASAYGSHTLYVGHGTTGNNRSCNQPGYNSVQSAVDAADNGDTVYLCGAQFAEQVFIGKSITLTGDDGSGLTATGATFSTDASDYPSQFTDDNLFLPQALLVTTGHNVTVDGLKISGPLPGNGGCANDEYGVLALDGNINLKNDDVANIQDTNPGLNGCQFGVGVEIGRTYWHNAAFTGYVTENFSASANISGTTVTGYAKNGITIDGNGSRGSIDNSLVVGGGVGQVAAQNGIQISRGATGSVTNSTVADNAYSGSGEATAAGVLVYGGYGDPLAKNVTVDSNKFIDNDVAVNFANYSNDGSGQATSVTNNVAKNNWIFSSKVTNTSGLYTSNDGWIGYQAGIEDVGDRDSACNNTIVGPGYADQGSYDTTTMTATPGSDNAVVRDIDAGYTFPTTNFSSCDYGHNYGGGHFNPNFFKFYDRRFDHNRWFFR